MDSASAANRIGDLHRPAGRGLDGVVLFAVALLFVRGAQSPRSHAWFSLAVFSCLLSALSKEVAVTIPVLILLYDRTFLAGVLPKPGGGAGRGISRWLHLGALGVGGLVRRHPREFGRVWGGAGLVGLRPRAISGHSRLFSLSAWPHPLVLDYGTGMVHHANPFCPMPWCWRLSRLASFMPWCGDPGSAFWARGFCHPSGRVPCVGACRHGADGGTPPVPAAGGLAALVWWGCIPGLVAVPLPGGDARAGPGRAHLPAQSAIPNAGPSLAERCGGGAVQCPGAQ